jgi:hypothetical protein
MPARGHIRRSASRIQTARRSLDLRVSLIRYCLAGHLHVRIAAGRPALDDAIAQFSKGEPSSLAVGGVSGSSFTMTSKALNWLRFVAA